MTAEIIDNLVQGIMYFICTFLTFRIWRKNSSRNWFTLGCYYACNLLALTYWTSYLAILGTTPHIFYVSDLAWVASYVFLVIFVRSIVINKEDVKHFRTVWCFVFAFVTAGVTVFYSLKGDILINVLYDLPLGITGWYAVKGFVFERKKGHDKKLIHFYAAMISLILLYFLLWVFSWLFNTEGWGSPYIWADFAVTIANIVLLYVFTQLRIVSGEKEVQA